MSYFNVSVKTNKKNEIVLSDKKNLWLNISVLFLIVINVFIVLNFLYNTSPITNFSDLISRFGLETLSAFFVCTSAALLLSKWDQKDLENKIILTKKGMKLFSGSFPELSGDYSYTDLISLKVEEYNDLESDIMKYKIVVEFTTFGFEIENYNSKDAADLDLLLMRNLQTS